MRNFLRTVCVFLYVVPALTARAQEQTTSFSLPVLPAEHRWMIGQETGVERTFLTTHPAADTNLYFYDWSWLTDGVLILFSSARGEGTAAPSR